jgi:hypothetical protein
MQKMVWSAMALAAVMAAGATPGIAWSQAAATAPAPATSAAKKELIAKMLELQAPEFEQLATQIAQQPAMQVIQAANAALQRIPPERREAIGRDIEADIRKYSDEAIPLVRSRAVSLAPASVGVLLEERFSEEELRKVLGMLQDPIWLKFRGAFPDINKTFVERLVSDVRSEVEPKVQAMQRSVSARLQSAAPASAAAPAPAPAPSPAPARAPARPPAPAPKP